ncbi:hypothetical protein R6Q59_011304 [Mikania micrantha]
MSANFGGDSSGNISVFDTEQPTEIKKNWWQKITSFVNPKSSTHQEPTWPSNIEEETTKRSWTSTSYLVHELARAQSTSGDKSRMT